MCHHNTYSYNKSTTMQSAARTVQQSDYSHQHQQSVVSSTSEKNSSSKMQTKLINQLRPFRKVAKSAQINLNRYWGLLSQRYNNSSSSKPSSSRNSQTTGNMEQYAAEMEQNRINELLEAQAIASEQNSLNSLFEEQYSSRASSTACFYEHCDCHLQQQQQQCRRVNFVPSNSSSTTDLYSFNSNQHRRAVYSFEEDDVTSQCSSMLL